MVGCVVGMVVGMVVGGVVGVHGQSSVSVVRMLSQISPHSSLLQTLVL